MHKKLLERAVHIIIILLGIFITYMAFDMKGYWQNVLISVGTNLIVVTIVFMIFDYFRITTSREISQQTTKNDEEKTSTVEKQEVPEELRDKYKERQDDSTTDLFSRDYGEKNE